MKANFDPEPEVIYDCFQFQFVSCKMSDIPCGTVEVLEIINWIRFKPMRKRMKGF